MSWKDASLSSLACFEESSLSSVSVLPSCIHRLKKRRFVSQSLGEIYPVRGSVGEGVGEHTMFGEMIKTIDDS